MGAYLFNLKTLINNHINIVYITFLISNNKKFFWTIIYFVIVHIAIHFLPIQFQLSFKTFGIELSILTLFKHIIEQQLNSFHFIYSLLILLNNIIISKILFDP